MSTEDTSPETPPTPTRATPGPPPETGTPTPAEMRRTWRRLAWDGALILALVALVWLAAQVKGFTVPFLIAFIIAYLLDPLVDRFEEAGVSRSLAIGILLGIFLVSAGLVLVILVPQVVREFSLIPAKLRLFVTNAQPWLEAALGTSLPDDLKGVTDALMAELDSDQAAALLKPAGTIAKTVFGSTATVLSAVVAIVLIPVFAFFLLRDFDLIVARI
ncbi:MAG: AI-2E family transporter, partial [Myxococcota bacterium]|nr:AI-2E family transporter [Myxococcota bacterium]